MRIDGIDVVFFWVDDLDTSVAWYTEVLGLNAGPRYGDWQEFAVDGGTRFALHGGRLAGGPATAAVAFNTPDLRAAIDELAGRGAVPIDEVTDTGAALFVTFSDPDGNHVQLLERRA